MNALDFSRDPGWNIWAFTADGKIIQMQMVMCT